MPSDHQADFIDGFNPSRDPTAGIRAFTNSVLKEKAAVRRAAGLTLVAAIKEELSTPGTGRIRRSGTKTVGKKGKKGFKTNIGNATRASAPGKPPAPDTGALRNSIEYHEQSGGQWVVGSDSPTAPPLEFGTNRAGRGNKTVILPRPFMRPAFEKVRKLLGRVAVGELRTRV